jgi:hypothetical protein
MTRKDVVRCARTLTRPESGQGQCAGRFWRGTMSDLHRCAGPLPSALRGPFLGWLQMVVPSHEARGSGRPRNEKRSLIQRKLARRGNCWGKELPCVEFLDLTGLVEETPRPVRYNGLPSPQVRRLFDLISSSPSTVPPLVIDLLDFVSDRRFQGVESSAGRLKVVSTNAVSLPF